MEHGNNERRNKGKSVPSRKSQQIFTKSYSDEQVGRLKRLLQNQHQREAERFYAIKVDGEFCVYKTSNVRIFDEYKEFVDGKTETVEIILYFGRSNNCNRHIFYLKDQPQNGLSGVDVEAQIQEALERQEQKHHIESLEGIVEEQEQIIDGQEKELEELRGKHDVRGMIQDGLSLLNAYNKSKTPDSGLAGTKPASSEVEFEARNESEKETQKEETEEQKKCRELYEELYAYYGEKELYKFCGLMDAIKNSDVLRDGVNQLIKEEKERRKEQ